MRSFDRYDKRRNSDCEDEPGVKGKNYWTKIYQNFSLRSLLEAYKRVIIRLEQGSIMPNEYTDMEWRRVSIHALIHNKSKIKLKECEGLLEKYIYNDGSINLLLKSLTKEPTNAD